MSCDQVNIFVDHNHESHRREQEVPNEEYERILFLESFFAIFVLSDDDLQQMRSLPPCHSYENDVTN